jgi:hypothetical protein
MNREQIIKGLKNFITNAHTKIYYPGGDDLIGDALALIMQLTEENERLKATKYNLHSDGRMEMIPTIESVKADTVRKMQERLKAKAKAHYFDNCNYAVAVEVIDQIAKEMLEGEG